MYKKSTITLSCFFIVSVLLTGCGASYHANQVRSGQDARRLTVGIVQRDIKKGMSGEQVAETLGSPNIVSTDEEGREVWVYDKFATDVVASASGWSVLFVGAVSGARSRSQRTLTIVIKFDNHKKVRDFAYHSSRF